MIVLCSSCTGSGRVWIDEDDWMDSDFHLCNPCHGRGYRSPHKDEYREQQLEYIARTLFNISMPRFDPQEIEATYQQERHEWRYAAMKVLDAVHDDNRIDL